MRKVLGFLFFCVISFNVAAHFLQENSKNPDAVDEVVVYEQSVEYVSRRNFDDNLKEKYSGKEFQYKELKEEKQEPKENNSEFWRNITKAFLFFVSKIFPFLLGGIIIFIILKTFLGADIQFWNFKKTKKKVAEKLIYEDDDIYQTDIDRLLQKAISEQNYKLAIRYYYLSVLKQLSDKKLIEYHKDKTNSEYLFEIENKDLRTQFSYLSYVFSYVWYGDFPVDETNFKLAEKKYTSFKTALQ